MTGSADEGRRRGSLSDSIRLMLILYPTETVSHVIARTRVRALALSKAFMHPGRTTHRNAKNVTSAMRSRTTTCGFYVCQTFFATRNRSRATAERTSSAPRSIHFPASATSSGYYSKLRTDLVHGLWENRTCAAHELVNDRSAHRTLLLNMILKNVNPLVSWSDHAVASPNIRSVLLPT